MSYRRMGKSGVSCCQGFSYLEILVAVALLALTLLPAIDALQVGVGGTAQHDVIAQQRYKLVSCMEGELNTIFGTLHTSLDLAASYTTPSNRSEPAGTLNRCLVYLGHYDLDNSDGDGDPFTAEHSDQIWVRVEIEGTPLAVESLVVD